MKHYLHLKVCYSFILIFIINSEKSVFSQNLFAKYSHIDFYADSKKTLATSTVIPFGEFRFSIQEENFNFGFTATSSKISRKLPFTIKAGNLSYGGIYSKLTNPQLSSSSSPFSTGISSVNSITASLPGFTSFSKPVSNFFELAYIKKNNNLKINSFYIPESQEAAFSYFISTAFFNNNLQIKNSGCAGLFNYSENTSSSWYPDSFYYLADNHLCAFFQTSISFFNFLTEFSAGFYETPFGKISDCYRIDNEIKTKHLTVFLSAAYNQNSKEQAVITPSDKTLEDFLQLRSGLQYKFITGIKNPIIIKTGIMTYGNIKLSQTEHPVKLAAGVQVTSNITAITLTGNISASDNSENRIQQTLSFKETSFQIKNSWYLKKLVPSLGFSFTYNPNEDFTSYSKKYKIDSAVNCTKFQKITAKGSLSITEKDSQYISKKLSGSITGKFMWKKLNITGKISGDIDM